MSTSHIMTIDLVNLQANQNNYKVISFPQRIKILSMSFSVNGVAAGSPELDRVWKLHAVGAHPLPEEENPWNEWTSPVFFNEEKPVLNNETASFYSTIATPYSELVYINGGSFLNFEVNTGVFAPNDYMALWIEGDAGNFDDIAWEDTEATVNIVYEDTSAKTPYELFQLHLGQYPQG